jgi:hypothetical protein
VKSGTLPIRASSIIHSRKQPTSLATTKTRAPQKRRKASGVGRRARPAGTPDDDLDGRPGDVVNEWLTPGRGHEACNNPRYSPTLSGEKNGVPPRRRMW